MAKIRPEMEISGRFLVSGQKIHYFSGRKNFGRNARNFGPPATSKVKNIEKKGKNRPNLKIFQIAKIRPEIEISGRFLVSGQKIHYFSGQKNFGRNARNFGSPAIFKVKNIEK